MMLRCSSSHLTVREGRQHDEELCIDLSGSGSAQISDFEGNSLQRTATPNVRSDAHLSRPAWSTRISLLLCLGILEGLPKPLLSMSVILSVRGTFNSGCKR